MTVSTGVISTIAGNGASTFSGDGSSATSASLQYPTNVALDSSGSILYLFFLMFALLFILPHRQRIHR